MLKINNLSKSYAIEKQVNHVLEDISLEINKGDFVMIMGESGSGKSTFMNTISTLDLPDSGEVFLEGKNILNLKPKEIEALRLQNFGYIFQENHMIDGLTILDNIMISRLQYDKNAKEKALDLMKLLGIEAIESNFPHQVSGGQRQRAAIARAMMNDPMLIFADEPSASLNPKTAETMLQQFRKLNEMGHTIVMVTHSVSVATYGTRLLVLSDRKFVCDQAIVGDTDAQRRECVLGYVESFL